MEKEPIKETVVEVCGELGIGLEEVVLFGSRARGDFSEDSDWNILLVTGRELGWKERLRLSGEIRKRLYEMKPTTSRILPLKLDIRATTLFRGRLPLVPVCAG